MVNIGFVLASELVFHSLFVVRLLTQKEMLENLFLTYVKFIRTGKSPIPKLNLQISSSVYKNSEQITKVENGE